MNNQQSNNALACFSSVGCDCGEGTAPEKRGTCGNKAGKLSRLAHFQRLEWARKQPGNCRRCGKPNSNKLAQCDRCRAYTAAYKRRVAQANISQPPEVLRVLGQFRRELDRLRRTVKQMTSERRRAYKMGYNAGKSNRRARFRQGAWIPPEMSVQELATINHAYENKTR